MGLTPKTWMLLLSILLFVWGCDGAVTASSASISGSDVVLEIAATASSGSDTGTITQFVVGSDTYELSDTHTLGMQLNIKDFEFVYDMEFQEPIDDIREKADPWELSFTMDEQYQSISKKYAEKLLTELSSTLTADSHKNGCDFGTATYFYMNDLSGNWANPTSDQYQATYQWTRQTIEDTYSWWSREIKGIGCSGFSGRLQWGAQTFTNDERNRWGITYLATGNPKGYMTCPGSYYNRSLDAGLTGLAQCTATSNDNSCQCGNCVPDGTYTDGCFYSAYFTGYEAPDGANAYMHASTTGTRANYDANGDVVSWSSYNSSQVSSNPNDDPSNLVVTINGISSPNYLNINGSWEASTTANLRQDAIDEYSDSISNYFTSNRLVIPDISLYRIAQGGSLVTPPASTFTIIPENMFDEEHGCDSVNVDGWSWFVGSHNIMTTAQSTVGDTCTISGSNAHLVNWCTDSFGTCLSNVLSTWQSRGSLPNATFPGFDMLNIANDYSTKISVTDKDPSNNPILSWAEDDIELTLTYGFNNAITSPLSIPTSSLQFKEPQIGTVTPDYTTAQTSTTHFNLDFDVQNSGAVSGEFYYYTSCSKANTADFVSGTTTIAAGATETISTSIPGPDCAETEFNSESPYSITFSYTKQALWSAVVETTITSQPPPPPSTTPTVCPTQAPVPSHEPTGVPVTADPTCEYAEQLVVTGSMNPNIIEHQNTCYERSEGMYMIDIITSTVYYVGTYTSSDENDLEKYTSIYECDQNNGAQGNTATTSLLVGTTVVFVHNWAETVAYFGMIYEPENPVSETVRFRLTKFSVSDYAEGSTARANLEAKILEQVCALNTGAECSQFSIEDLVDGSIIVVMNIDSIEAGGESLIDIRANLRNELASYAANLNDPASDADPLNTLDRYYWNNKAYEVIFTYCPVNQNHVLADGETEMVITWHEPTVESSSGHTVTPDLATTVEVANGDSKGVGTYYIKYHAQYNGEHAYPCSFFIKVTSNVIPTATTAQMVDWMSNDMMLLTAAASALIGAVMFCCCWRQFGINLPQKEEKEMEGIVTQGSIINKEKKKIKTETRGEEEGSILDLESSET